MQKNCWVSAGRLLQNHIVLIVSLQSLVLAREHGCPARSQQSMRSGDWPKTVMSSQFKATTWTHKCLRCSGMSCLSIPTWTLQKRLNMIVQRHQLFSKYSSSIISCALFYFVTLTIVNWSGSGSKQLTLRWTGLYETRSSRFPVSPSECFVCIYVSKVWVNLKKVG